MIKYDTDDLELVDDYEDSDIFKQAVPSQYQSALYNKLKKDKRLDDFLRVLRACALSGKTLKETCEVISKLFRSYVRNIGISPELLNKMRNRYKDIEQAMGFDNDYNLLSAYENAALLAAKTESITEAISFIDRFGKGSIYDNMKAEEKEEAKPGVSVNINNYSPQTKSTDDLIWESLNSIELVPPKGAEDNGSTES